MGSGTQTLQRGEYHLNDGDLITINGVPLNTGFLNHIHSMIDGESHEEMQLAIASGMHDYALLVHWTENNVASLNVLFLWEIMNLYKFYHLAARLIKKEGAEHD
jgi:hypothetical protein